MEIDLKYFKLLYKRLENYYGEPETPLTHRTNEQLAVAVILSAQTTDNQVNQVTPALFEKYPDMESLGQAPLKEIEKIIFSTGFYRAKAANIKKFGRIVSEEYGGKLPRSMEALLELPGVGRKTANVIMDCAFDTSCGVVVDTHVKRLSKRLGLTQETTPEKVERDLMAKLPKSTWKNISLYMIYLGREFCMARKPNCGDCFLNDICPSSGEAEPKRVG